MLKTQDQESEESNEDFEDTHPTIAYNTGVKKKRDTVNTTGTDRMDQYDSYRERKTKEATRKT